MNRSWLTTVVALLFASFLGLLEVLRLFLGRAIEIRAGGWIGALHVIVVLWGTLVLVSPWCAFMVRRFAFRRGRTLRTLLAHLGGAAVFVAIHMALNLTIHSLFTGESHVGLGFPLLHMYGFYVAMELSVYAMIVLALMLLEARREAAERALASARLAEGLATARLESLQAQIRPHFLFNTLNALAVLARKGDGAAVDRAIGDLGELLRASFDTSGRHEIRLGEELEFLERYLHLQRIRFPDRLEVDWRVDDEARQALVPPLLVQPLVENALEHGLATRRGGRVRVAARRERDELAIEVADEGPGFGGSPGERPGGTGLVNTRERLALLYGERGVLSCGDQPGGGAVVRIRIPWRLAGAPVPVPA